MRCGGPGGRAIRIGSGILLALAASGAASAQTDPFIGPGQFPAYRNLSGLSGSGFGVGRDGFRSLSGATALSTPVAHVLGHGQVHAQYGAMSFRSTPRLRLKESNGTFAATFGFTVARVNTAVGYMVLSDAFEQAMNLQIQPIPAARARWSGSIGVQGLIGAAKSHGVTEPAGQDSRSWFGVATYGTTAGGRALHLSGGIGTRRFRRPFGSASYHFGGPVRLWTEQDGYGVNAGALLTVVRPGHSELNVSFGYIKARYFLLAAGIGF